MGPVLHPSVQFVLDELTRLEEFVAGYTDAISDLTRTECNAPKTAGRLEFRTSLFLADLQRQRDLVRNLPDPSILAAKPGRKPARLTVTEVCQPGDSTPKG